ncbi:MAG: hypothetical protein IT292_04830 [Deltaproteobacteria bacterium]|nr:hypothetical protein [Deltaproteobacteria bacterium]
MKLNLSKIFFTLLCSLPLLVSPARSENIIRLALPYVPGELHPLAIEEPVNRIILANIASSLVRTDKDKIILDAATRLESTAAQDEWNITINPQAKFRSKSPADEYFVQDSYNFYSNLARELSADSAKQNNSHSDNPAYQTHLINSIPPYLLEKLLSIKTDIVISRSSQQGALYRVQLTEPSANFSKWVLTLPLINAKQAVAFAQLLGSGTNTPFLGPYSLSENRPEQLIVLRANDYYYRPTYPRTAVIEFRSYASATDALSALRTGAIDIIPFPTAEMIADTQNDTIISQMENPLINLKQSPKISNWKLYRNFWSQPNNEQDQLITETLLKRKTLQSDDNFRLFFDLTGCKSILSY